MNRKTNCCWIPATNFSDKLNFYQKHFWSEREITIIVTRKNSSVGWHTVALLLFGRRVWRLNIAHLLNAPHDDRWRELSVCSKWNAIQSFICNAITEMRCKISAKNIHFQFGRVKLHFTTQCGSVALKPKEVIHADEPRFGRPSSDNDQRAWSRIFPLICKRAFYAICMRIGSVHSILAKRVFGIGSVSVNERPKTKTSYLRQRYR